MRWISNLDKKFVVPILLGVSLTTLGCISLAILFYPIFEKVKFILLAYKNFLYYIYFFIVTNLCLSLSSFVIFNKVYLFSSNINLSIIIALQDDETKDDSNNTKRSRKIITSRCTTIELKVPKQFASAIIGRGGSMIQKIQDATGTHIIMNSSDIEFPYCLCIIQGNEIEGIRLAESMIKNIIDNQPIIETYELLVPYETCGYFGILKKHGDTVQQIQRSSGVKLIMENGCAYKPEGAYLLLVLL